MSQIKTNDELVGFARNKCIDFSICSQCTAH